MRGRAGRSETGGCADIAHLSGGGQPSPPRVVSRAAHAWGARLSTPALDGPGLVRVALTPTCCCQGGQPSADAQNQARGGLPAAGAAPAGRTSHPGGRPAAPGPLRLPGWLIRRADGGRTRRWHSRRHDALILGRERPDPRWPAPGRAGRLAGAAGTAAGPPTRPGGPCAGLPTRRANVSRSVRGRQRSVAGPWSPARQAEQQQAHRHRRAERAGA